MAKVYVEFEEPESCSNCPLFYATEGAFSDVCQLLNESTEKINDLKEKLENCPLKKVEENKEWKKLEHWRLFELYKKAHPGDFQHLTKDDQHYSREELFKLAFTLGCAVREKAEHVENLTYKSFEWLM